MGILVQQFKFTLGMNRENQFNNFDHSNMALYSIVEFPETETQPATVEVVPSRWLRSGEGEQRSVDGHQSGLQRH